MEEKNNNPLNEVIIEDVAKENKDKFKHLIINVEDHDISTPFNKGKGVLTTDEIVVDIPKQLYKVNTNAYKHNLN